MSDSTPDPWTERPVDVLWGVRSLEDDLTSDGKGAMAELSRDGRNETNIVVIGGGGHGLVVAAAIVASGSGVAGFYDDDPSLWGQTIGGHQVVGPVSELKDVRSRAIVAIGDNATRKRIVQGLDLEWATVVHPFSWVAPDASLGRGTFVGAGTIVQPSSIVGDHVILNSRAGLGHDAFVDSFAHISVAYLGSGSRLGEGALLAIGSSVLPGVDVGRWATVGAGAVVTRDVVARSVVLGVPARPQRAFERLKAYASGPG